MFRERNLLKQIHPVGSPGRSSLCDNEWLFVGHGDDGYYIDIFLHYWSRGPAEKLATAFKAAGDELGKGGSPSH